MIKILRFSARALLMTLAIPSSVCMAAFWLCAWTPFILLGAILIFLTEFANGEKFDENPLRPIIWFFWTYVMFNPEKGDKWL